MNLRLVSNSQASALSSLSANITGVPPTPGKALVSWQREHWVWRMIPGVTLVVLHYDLWEDFLSVEVLP